MQSKSENSKRTSYGKTAKESRFNIQFSTRKSCGSTVCVCVCVCDMHVCVWCFIAYKVLALTLETFLKWSNFMRQYWEYGYPSLKEEERCSSLERLSYLPKATW